MNFQISQFTAGAILLISIWANPGFGAADLDQAFNKLLSYTWSETREPLNAIETAIQESDPSGRKVLEQRLAAVLRSRAPFPAKQYACRKLSQIATAQSVPVLASLLNDPALSHSVRLVLERIPHPAAAAALRDALPKSTHAPRLGIINSLGVLRDSEAVTPLTRLLDEKDETVVSAALAALGHIATADAVEALEAFRKRDDTPLRSAATKALLVAGGHLVSEGHQAQAAAVFRQLYPIQEPPAVREAAFRGLVLSQPEEAFSLLSDALVGNDDRIRALAARLLADKTATPSLHRFADLDCPPLGQIALLEACRYRRDLNGRPLALKALQSIAPETRLAALRALAAIGRAEDISALAALAASAGEQQTLARAALVGLPDPEADSAMAQALAKSAPPLVLEFINALAARGATEASPAIATQLTHPDQSVRMAALQALSVIGAEAQVAPIIETLVTDTNSLQREVAESTLISIAQRVGSACADDLAEALPRANSESRIVLLRVLGVAGGPIALAAIRSALSDTDPGISDAAFRVLANWSTADAAPDLLRLSQSATNSSWRALALRGFVRLARQDDASSGTRLHMLRDAMKSARSLEEKRLVIAALGDLGHPESLSALAPQLNDPELAQETCAAIVNLATRVAPADLSRFLPALRQVLRVASSQQIRENAEAVLTKFDQQQRAGTRRTE